MLFGELIMPIIIKTSSWYLVGFNNSFYLDQVCLFICWYINQNNMLNPHANKDPSSYIKTPTLKFKNISALIIHFYPKKSQKNINPTCPKKIFLVIIP